MSSEFEGFNRTVSTRAARALKMRRGASSSSPAGIPTPPRQPCYAIWEKLPAGKEADLETLAEARESVMNAEHSHFSLLWDNAASTQRLLLEALVKEPGRPYSNAYLGPSTTCPRPRPYRRLWRALTEKEVVAKREDGGDLSADPRA